MRPQLKRWAVFLESGVKESLILRVDVEIAQLLQYEKLFPCPLSELTIIAIASEWPEALRSAASITKKITRKALMRSMNSEGNCFFARS